MLKVGGFYSPWNSLKKAFSLKKLGLNSDLAADLPKSSGPAPSH
jgi:hypothetical protein